LFKYLILKKMKTILKLVLVLTIIALCSNVSAQTPKLAYVNMNELIVSMPDYDLAMAELQNFEKELTEFLEEMQVEWNRKYEEYSKNQANWSDLVKQAKTDELTTMQQRIQTSQQKAQEDFEMKNSELLQPVIEKANKAIEDVAKAQGINGVLNDQAFVFKDASMINLLPAVQKHLGIQR